MRVLSAPTGQMNSEFISIEELKKKAMQVAQSSVEDISNKPTEPFTYDQLKMAWRAFAYEIRESKKLGSETVFSIMTKKEPKLEDNNIVYTVDNAVVHELMMNNFGEELLYSLRKKLNNWGVTLEVKVVENSDDLPQFMTGKDRFQQMAQKNINLITLLKTFNLDVEL